MARLTLWAAVAVAAAVALGCDPAKELPDLPKSPEAQDSGPVIPPKSQPEAEEFVKQALKAYTGGKPELLEKGKVSRVTLKGTMVSPIDPQARPVETTRSIAAVWPNRLAFTNETRGEGQMPTLSAYLNRPKVTILNGGEVFERGDPVERERNLAADAAGQHWMTLLLPLADPGAVVFGLRNQAGVGSDGQPSPFRVLMLHRKGFPLYQLAFDPASLNLVEVDYERTEAGLPVKWVWQMAGHKSVEGLVLPSRMLGVLNGKRVEQWEEAKWEFPAAIDDAEFAPPQPKQ